MIDHILKAVSTVNTTDIDLDVVDRFVALHAKQEESVNSLLSRGDLNSYSFVQLKPVSFSPKKLFTSEIETGNAYQLSVAPAVLNSNGEWVPDEDNCIVKGLVPHRVIIESVFNTSSADVHPFSITELDTKPVEFAESSLGRKNSYGSSFKRTQSSLVERLNSVKEEISLITGSNLSFSKKNTGNLISNLNIIISSLSSDLKYPLERDSSQFDQDLYEIKKEFQDGIVSEIMKTSNPISLLGDSSNSRHSRIEDYFNYIIASEEYSDVEVLLSRYAESLKEYSLNEVKKDILRFANSFSNQSLINQSNLASMGKGFISFSKSSSSGVNLFGENREFNSFFSLNIGFAYENQSHSGKIKVSEVSQFLELYLSEYQIMELIQCSLSGGWIKSSLGQLCGKSVNLPSKDDHSDIKIDGSYTSDIATHSICIANEIKDILEDSASKKKKLRLDTLILELESYVFNEIEVKAEVFKSRQIDVFEQYKSKSSKDLSSLSSLMTKNHPALSSFINNKVLTLSNK